MAKRQVRGYIPAISATIAKVNNIGAEKLGVPVWAAVASAATAELEKAGLKLKNDREKAVMLTALFAGMKYGAFLAKRTDETHIEGEVDVRIPIEPGRVDEGA